MIDMKKIVNGVPEDLSAPEVLQRVAEEADWEAARAARRAQAIRSACSARILLALPDWKQRNLTARTLELVNERAARSLTAPELAELAANQEKWDWVKAMRGASNAAEAAGVDLDAIDWPAFPA